MIIYSHTLTTRLQYVVQFLSSYFQYPFKLTANEQYYAMSAEFKINYSHQRISSEEVYISPHVLLFENEKRRIEIRCFEHNGYPAFFETSGDLSFDILAAIFFLLSRYEEYLPHEKDFYGLYAHQNSLAYQNGFLNQPLINIWLEDFRLLLEKKFQAIYSKKNSFQFLPTYDIDIAWSYKNKEFKIHTGNLIRSLIKGKWKDARERISVVKGKQKDPFDAYEWMDELHREFNLHPIYFFLVAEQKGKYDKNINVHNSEFRELIKTISGEYQCGIHPSWFSGDNPSQLPKEKKWLEDISQKKITISRQHYLRFHLPSTFERLQSIGITDEYSMGYGSINGFRASITSPFYWYNLEKEEITSLLLHPFCFMDANAYYEQHLSAQQALEELHHFYKVVKEVDGTMITLWHNNFLGAADQFSGWKEIYRSFIENVSTDK